MKLRIALLAVLACSTMGMARIDTLQQGFKGYTGTMDKYFNTPDGSHGGAAFGAPAYDTEKDQLIYTYENG